MLQCPTLASARPGRQVLAALENRMAEVGRQLHPDKTRNRDYELACGAAAT